MPNLTNEIRGNTERSLSPNSDMSFEYLDSDDESITNGKSSGVTFREPSNILSNKDTPPRKSIDNMGSHMSFEYLSNDNTEDSNILDNFSESDYSWKNSDSLDSNNDSFSNSIQSLNSWDSYSYTSSSSASIPSLSEDSEATCPPAPSIIHSPDSPKGPKNLNIPTPNSLPIKPIPSSSIDTSGPSPFEIDRIGCFNINKHYNHETVAELMLRGNFTLLGIQEPFSSNVTQNKSWSTYRIADLESARFKSFESKYQILIFDEEKWGGRNIEQIQIYQDGRIVAIPFQLSHSQIIGIISIYAITTGDSILADGNSKTKIRQETTKKINAIFNKWRKRYPQIFIVMMGDFQETWTTTNLDNLGNFRKDMDENGILAQFANTYTSIVRDNCASNNLPYWTRTGNLGARGIDHILVPTKDTWDDWNCEGSIEKELGHHFFSSDHSLLTMKLTRREPNENRQTLSKMEFAFSNIANIPLSCSENNDHDLTFDENKFKCERLLIQKKLFDRIRALTCPSSKWSNELKIPIDRKIKNLFKDLFNLGISTNRNGQDNRLIKIDEGHATAIEEITLNFKHAIEEIMAEMKLDREVNELHTAKKKRTRLKMKGCTKPLVSLPVTSKIRLAIKHTERFIQSLRNILAEIKLENNIRRIINLGPNKYESLDGSIITSQENKNKNIVKCDNCMTLNKGPPTSKKINRYKHKWKTNRKSSSNKPNTSTYLMNIESSIRKLVNSNKLEKLMVEILEELMKDKDFWDNHINAIKHSRDNGDVPTDKVYGPTINFLGADFLQGATDDDIEDFNALLKGIQCSHIFKFDTQDNANPGGLPDTLHNTNSWKEILLELRDWAGFINTADKSSLDDMSSHINKSIKELNKILNSLRWTQQSYKHGKMNHACESNNLKSLTNIMKPKAKHNPSVHTSMWDKSTKEWRNCVNEEEELIATKLYHEKWMSKSKAEENCFFASLITEGSLGIRGVTQKPERIITREDVKKLVNPYNKMNEETIQAVMKAHGSHTAKMYTSPIEHNKEFNYPFFLINNTGTIHPSGSQLETDFWKAMKSIPTKARHNNFHISILGRFDKDWTLTLLNISKLIMITRFIPKCIKELTRYPIPKPNKPNEYRPLSICDDFFCFLNGVYAKVTSAATEKANILHEAVTAYRPGKGCQMMVSVELCLREDCIESGKLCAHIMEDEEKFFDRISPENVLNSMLYAGFPKQGFVEFKGSSMSFKKVYIKTSKGTIESFFECGLEQGNPDSPRAANLIIKQKHDMWKSASEFNTNYKFHTTDEEDGIVEVGEAGYSDDNEDFLWMTLVKDLLRMIQKKIDYTGDFSIVTKVGRKGSKCVILLFNVPARVALSMIKFYSTAWSFEDDMPTKENMQIILYLNAKEAHKIDPNYHEPIQITYDENNFIVIKTKSEFENIKHLGLTMSTNGNTAESSEKIIQNIKTKILELKLTNIHDGPQRYSCNMLLNSLHSFATLTNNINFKHLQDCDKNLVKTLRKQKGLAIHDMSLHIFVSEKKFGYGIFSFVDTYMKAISRELLVTLNSKELDGRSIRGRLSSFIKTGSRLNALTYNHIGDAITKLSHFGLFLRDKKHGLINYLLEGLLNKLQFRPIGFEDFSKTKENFLGKGNAMLGDFVIGGKYHHLANAFIKFKNENNLELLKNATNDKKRLSYIEHLDDIWDLCNSKWLLDNTDLYKCIEWKYSLHDTNPNSSNTWNSISCLANDIDREQTWRSQDIWNSIRNTIELDPDSHVTWTDDSPVPMDDYGLIFTMILNSKSPLVIATDGGLKQSKQNLNIASACMTWCLLDIRNDETIQSGEWRNRAVIPILQRLALLPHKLGAIKTDIGHAELLAFCMEEESLISNIPRIVIMDSDPVRKRILNLRDNLYNSDRDLIRNIYGGLGSTLITRAHNAISRANNCSNIFEKTSIKNEELEYYNTSNVKLRDSLLLRNKEFIVAQNNWIDNEEISNWKSSYMDGNEKRCILEIDSHQLDQSGLRINPKSRYPSITPNLALLNANHWADIGASKMIKRCENLSTTEDTFSIPENPSLPFGNLRFAFTYNGELIEKNQCKFISDVLEKERILRIHKREYQGLLFRMAEFSTISPRDIGRKSSYRKFLSNLTKSHTRSCYKSKGYLVLNIMNHENITPDKAQDKFIALMREKKLLSDYEHILSCPYCDQQKFTKISSKEEGLKRGNRRHLFCFCQNPTLLKFRNGANKKIEDLILLLFNLAIELGNPKSGLHLCHRINKNLLLRSNQEAGKLRLHNITSDTQTHNNGNYLNINAWCKKFNITNINDGISKKIPILQAILGLSTALRDGELEDMDMGSTDCINLSIFPKSLEKTILEFFREICSSMSDATTKKAAIQNASTIWARIKAAAKARAIGMHRAIKLVNEDHEKSLRSRYKIKKIMMNNKKAKVILSSLDDDQITQDETKLCEGITCLPPPLNSPFINKCKTPNKIKATHSKCSRCMNEETATRRKNWILKNIADDKNQNTLKVVELFMNDHDDKKIIGNFLNLCLRLFGAQPPWLTPENIIPHKSRGIKPNARKPAKLAIDMISNALSQPLDINYTVRCSYCRDSSSRTPGSAPNIPHIPKNTIIPRNDETCLNTNSPNCDCCRLLFHISKNLYNKDTTYILNSNSAISYTSDKIFPSHSSPPRTGNDKWNSLLKETTSPIIRDNLLNLRRLSKRKPPNKSRHIYNTTNPTSTSPNFHLTKLKKPYIDLDSIKRKIFCDLDSNTNQINKACEPNNTHVKPKQPNRPSTNPPRSEPSLTSNTIKKDDSNELPKAGNTASRNKSSSLLRIPNNILRSGTLNAAIAQLKNKAPPLVFFANATMLNFSHTWKISKLSEIPDNINFTDPLARKKHPGIYLFPYFIGPFHHGRWTLIIIQKRHSQGLKNVDDKNNNNCALISNNCTGWIIDYPPQTPTFNSTIPINEATNIIESCTYFNTKIKWYSPPCVNLLEKECGARVITASMMLILGLRLQIPLLDMVTTEICNFPITSHDLIPHLCRETAHLLINQNQTSWTPSHLLSNSLLQTACKDNPTSRNTPLSNIKPTRKRKLSTSKKRAYLTKKKQKKGKDVLKFNFLTQNRNSPPHSIKKIKKNPSNPLSDTHPNSSNPITTHTKHTPPISTKPLSFTDLPTNTLHNTIPIPQRHANSIYSRPNTNAEFSSIQILATPPRELHYVPSPTRINFNHNKKTYKKSSPRNFTTPISINRNTTNSPLPITPKTHYECTKSFNLPSFLNQFTDNNHIIQRIDQDTISVGSIRSLLPGRWLNDEVIHMAMKLIEKNTELSVFENSNHIRVGFFKSFFMTQLLGPEGYNYNRVRRWSLRYFNGNIFILETLIIPINMGNSHWAILSIRFQLKEIELLDSLNNNGSEILEAALRYLGDEYSNTNGIPWEDRHNWSLISRREDIPQQQNNYDCGIYTCLFAEACSTHSRPTFSPDFASSFRLTLATYIIRGAWTRT